SRAIWGSNPMPRSLKRKLWGICSRSCVAGEPSTTEACCQERRSFEEPHGRSDSQIFRISVPAETGGGTHAIAAGRLSAERGGCCHRRHQRAGRVPGFCGAPAMGGWAAGFGIVVVSARPLVYG